MQSFGCNLNVNDNRKGPVMWKSVLKSLGKKKYIYTFSSTLFNRKVKNTVEPLTSNDQVARKSGNLEELCYLGEK